MGHENENSASNTKGFYFDLAPSVAHKTQFQGLTPRNRRFPAAANRALSTTIASNGCEGARLADMRKGRQSSILQLFGRIEFDRRRRSTREPTQVFAVGIPREVLGLIERSWASLPGNA